MECTLGDEGTRLGVTRYVISAGLLKKYRLTPGYSSIYCTQLELSLIFMHSISMSFLKFSSCSS
jgi:hypothetical protein